LHLEGGCESRSVGSTRGRTAEVLLRVAGGRERAAGTTEREAGGCSCQTAILVFNGLFKIKSQLLRQIMSHNILDSPTE